MRKKERKPSKLVLILFIASTILTFYLIHNISEMETYLTNLINMQEILSKPGVLQQEVYD